MSAGGRVGKGKLPIGLLTIALAQLTLVLAISNFLYRAGEAEAAMLLGMAALVVFALEILLRRQCEAVGLARTSTVRNQLFAHLMTVDQDVVAKRRHGAMLQSFVGDLTALRQWTSDGVLRGTLALITLAAVFSWLAWTRPAIFAPLAGIVAAAIVIGYMLLRPLSTSVEKVRRERGRVSAFASERLAAQATVKAYGRAHGETSILDRKVLRLNRAALGRASLTGALRALPHLASTLMLLTIIARAGDLSGGGLAAAIVLVGVIGLALRDLARAGELLVPGRIAIGRLDTLLSLPVTTATRVRTGKTAKSRGLVISDLRLKGVRTRFNAQANHGDIIILRGDASLCTALCNAIAGINDSDTGQVSWNGKALAAMSLGRRRRLIGLASNELPLVPGTAARNIRYRVRRIDQVALAQLAAQWKVDLASRDEPPSLIILLRALAGTPPILLVDMRHLPHSKTAARTFESTIRNWPGVVLVVEGLADMTSFATAAWQVEPNGIKMGSVQPQNHLYLVDTQSGGVTP